MSSVQQSSGRNSHTLCENVLNSVYIDRDGTVYSCCYDRPISFGNIYQSHLEEILQGPRVKKYQDLSRCGKLPCFENCTLLDFNQKTAALDALPTMSTFPHIKKLVLTFGWLCNVDCVMCPQDHRSTTTLDVEILKSNVTWANVDRIIVEGGEPFAIRGVYDLWDYLISIGKTLNFISNGQIMNERVATKVVQFSDYVYLSFNASTQDTYQRVVRKGSWEKLLRNLQLVKDARRYVKPQFPIIGHFTMVPENLHECATFIDLAAQLEIDIVNYGYNRYAFVGQPVDELLAVDTLLRSDLTRQMRQALHRSRGKVKVDSSRLQYLGILDKSDDICHRVVFPSGT